MASRKIIAPLLILFCLVWQTASQGATFISYLLVQGPFGPGSTTETQKWEVTYDEGTLTTGQALLNAVFGIPPGAQPAIDPANPTYSTTGLFAGGPYDYFNSGNTTQRVKYFDFTPLLNTAIENTSLFVESFTLHSSTVAMASDYSTGWSYFNAGGTDGDSLTYDQGNWTIGNSGQQQRTLANISFDAWVFGDFSGDVAEGTTVNAPVASNFSSAHVINLSSTPEPGRLLLIWMGGMTLVLRRRRIRESR